MTDQELKDLVAANTLAIAKLEQQSKRTDEKVNNLCRKIDSFIGNYGEATEEYFFRSLEANPCLNGIHFDKVQRNLKISDHHVEFDIVLINKKSICIIEVKSKAHHQEIPILIDKKLKHFKIDYPEYKGYQYYFGIASLVTHQAMVQAAKQQGIFLLTQKGNHIEIVNSDIRVF